VRLAISDSGIVCVSDPIQKGSFAHEAHFFGTLLWSNDFDLMIVGVGDVQGVVCLTKVDSEGVLQLRLVPWAFFVTKVEQVESIVIGTSHIHRQLRAKTQSPNGRAFRIGNEETFLTIPLSK